MQLGLFEEVQAPSQTLAPDLAARKILVWAYLYYVMDSPIVSDGEYDKMSIVAADGWNCLHPTRQWALGDPGSAKAGGSHFKFTTINVDAARRAYAEHHGRPPKFPYPQAWLKSEEHGRYVTAIAQEAYDDT